MLSKNNLNHMNKFLITVIAVIALVAGFYIGKGFGPSVAGSAPGFTSFTSLEYTGMLQSDGTSSITPTATTTYKMVESEISPLVVFNSATTTATTALYLPASTSLATLIPTAGSSVSFRIYNATTTSTSTATITTNTGVTLVKASSGVIVNAGGVAEVTLFRKADTDIIATLDINN
jgi:hypothetical protein